MRISDQPWTSLSRFLPAYGVYVLKPNVWGRVGPDPWVEVQVETVRGPQACGMGKPGPLPKGLHHPNGWTIVCQDGPIMANRDIIKDFVPFSSLVTWFYSRQICVCLKEWQETISCDTTKAMSEIAALDLTRRMLFCCTRPLSILLKINIM